MNKLKRFFHKHHYTTGDGIKIMFSLSAHIVAVKITRLVNDFTHKHTGRYTEYHSLMKKILAAGFTTTNNSTTAIVFKRDGVILNCRKFSSDLNVVNQIFVHNYFDDVVAFINEHGVKINTIIDLGANAGYVAAYFHAYYKNARIITVEPDPGNYTLLEKNMADNGVDAVNINAGIYKYKTRLYFDRTRGDNAHWGIKLTEKPISSNYIETTSIDDIVSQYKIESVDLLKMSIEGVESLVFNEEETNIDFIKKTKIIAIKIHDMGVVKARITKILAARGFQFFQAGEFFVAHKLL